MISAQTVAMMKRVAATLFTDTCTIEQQSTVINELGTPSTVYTIVASGVACRVITTRVPASGAEIVGEGESLQDMYRIELATTQTVDINYRITVGGAVYDVLGIEDALTSEVFTQVIASRHR